MNVQLSLTILEPTAVWFFSFLLGLLLEVLLPAAAWYFIFIVCPSCPREGKMDTQGVERNRQAKALLV
jgi:hypothetical protein